MADLNPDRDRLSRSVHFATLNRVRQRADIDPPRGLSSVNLPSVNLSSVKLDVAIAFDTTGSMYRFFEQVRRELAHLSRVLQRELTQTQIGAIAYGDYCDGGDSVTTVLDLTADTQRLTEFFQRVQRTDGGDFPEAVEEALFAANQLRWRLGSRRAMVLVGDAPPHGVLDSAAKCERGHFWRQEIAAIARKGIRLYTVQCGKHPATKQVFQSMARLTQGQYLHLDHIQDLMDLLIGVCMKETGQLGIFQEQLRRSQRLTQSKAQLLQELESYLLPGERR